MLLQILSSLTVLLLTGLESNVNAPCVVDKVIYRDGDPIPTDDACESCKCRPPGFSCVLRECEIKPGCKAIRREGECCPEYQCGCEHNGKFFKDGDRIPNAESPCYSCYCQGSSITCGLADCQFRFDCEPEYIQGECCPRYDHCPPDPLRSTTTTTPLSSSTTTTDRPSSSETSPTPIFISSPPPPTPHSPSSATADEIVDVTTMTPIPSKSDPPAAVSQAEKQAASSGSQPLLTPDVTDPSSSSLNQTSKAEATPVTTSASSPAPASAREPVQDEVAITIVTNPSDSKPVSMQDNSPPSIVTTAGSIEIAQDEYMTTRTWIPDSELPAEHRQQQGTIKGSPTNSSQVAQVANVTLAPDSSSAPSVWTPVPVPASNSSRVRPVSDSADEIRIAEPASDSLLPDFPPLPVTTVENNLVT